jgi:hypothetical protein
MLSKADPVTILGLDTVVKQDETVLATEIGPEIALMRIESGMCFGLNPIGRDIWDAIKTPKSLRDVCEALQARYNVAPDTCEAEVLALVSKMVEKQLVHLDAAG